MITDFFIIAFGIIGMLLNGILAIVQGVIPIEFQTSLDYILSNALKANDMFPVATILFCMSIIFNVYLFRLSWNLIMGMFSLIRKGGRMEI